MILTELDNELGGLFLKHKEINKSALALKYGVDRHTIDRHIKAIEAPTERKLRECGLVYAIGSSFNDIGKKRFFMMKLENITKDMILKEKKD